jgi:4-hydroxybenzoate polyprenyltransferase
MRDVDEANRHDSPPISAAISTWFDRIRIRRWVHLLPLPLATFDAATQPSDAVFGAVRGVANAFGILGFGYLLNSVADRQTDLDAQKNPFIGASAAEYRYSLAGFIAVSVTMAALSPWPAQLATFVCLAMGCVYSIGPRLKNVPIAATLMNAAGFAPLLFVGMRTAALPWGFGYVVLAFAALLLQNQLIHEAADQIEDAGAGIRTSWMVLGPAGTALVMACAGGGIALAAIAVAPSARAVVAGAAGLAFALIFPLLLAARGNEPRRAARLRLAHRWCAVVFGAGFFALWRWN